MGPGFRVTRFSPAGGLACAFAALSGYHAPTRFLLSCWCSLCHVSPSRLFSHLPPLLTPPHTSPHTPSLPPGGCGGSIFRGAFLRMLHRSRPWIQQVGGVEQCGVGVKRRLSGFMCCPWIQQVESVERCGAGEKRRLLTEARPFVCCTAFGNSRWTLVLKHVSQRLHHHTSRPPM